MKGKFITIEGLDGAGKTTQIQLMKEFLERNGHRVLVTREPGGTSIGEKIRQIVLDQENQEMSYVTEALLYAASRGQLVKQVIVPALERGETVICDRYVDSSLVYQGWGRSLGIEAVKAINDFATQGLEPDLTLFFDLSPEEGLKRVASRGKGDRLDQEKVDFHHRVYEAYHQLVKKYPQRIQVIRADGDIQSIQLQVEAVLNQFILGNQ